MAAPHISTTTATATDDGALAAAKAVARQDGIARRAGQDPTVGQRLADHAIRDLHIAPGAMVGGFWSIQDEIDTCPLLAALHERGHPLALPVTGRRGEALVFRVWRPGEPLLPGRFGTSHPSGAIVTPDVFLVPLLAFDRQGYRLGYGGGFYDRTLALLPQALRIGCAFSAQELDSVPRGPYDQKLHAVLTEAGLRYFPSPAGRAGL